MSWKWVAGGVATADRYLFGRRTYESFAAHWPTASGDQEQTVAQPLNERPKYVVSSTLTEPLDWHNSRLLRGDITDAVTELKAAPGGDIHVIGSTRLVQMLIEHRLIDEFRLMIDPIVLGAGKRFFPTEDALASLQLLESQVTSTGAILAIYTLIPRSAETEKPTRSVFGE